MYPCRGRTLVVVLHVVADEQHFAGFALRDTHNFTEELFGRFAIPDRCADNDTLA